MKIDFNENGMTINFDKVPKFLYFNENEEGCGVVFLDGVRTKLLQDIRVHAHTRDDKGRHPLEYTIKHGEKDGNSFKNKTISCNMRDEISIGVKILDYEQFKNVITCIKEFIKDERISEDVQQEYAQKIVAAVKPGYVIYSGNGIYDFGTEDECK